jgi:methyl-branched lipid omega-hydroxylase
MALNVADIDISDPEFWTASLDHREEVFRTLRRDAPVKFFEEAIFPGFPQGPGYFALTKFDDVWHASRNPKTFCSGQGTNIPDIPLEIAEFFGSMIALDAPRHTKLRNIVQKGFTPKQVAQIEGYVREKATSIIDKVIAKYPNGQCDFVTEIAALLPLEIICEMMGIPESDTQQIFDWTNVILGAGDPEYGGTFDILLAKSMEMFAYANALGESRLANPTDDLTSAIMHAEVDGERLTPSEFGSFFILLVVAGNETTRNAISHGMRMLTLHEDQRSLLWNDFEANITSATEEIVRWASPVIHFRRTVTEDTEVRGVPMKAGQKVVLFYNSANRCEDHWTDPYSFNILRTPNDHVGYGAGGPHFCLGANLARREIQTMFREIHRRLPDLRITGEPARLQSNFINGIKHMECAWSEVRD